MNQSLKYLTVVGFTGALAACGGGGSSSSTGETGSVSVGLTDAPVDSAREVNIEVTALVLQPSDGERSRFELEFPEPINLLDLQGGAFESLISDEEVPAGAYNWMRLELGDDNTVVIDNETGTGTYPLTTPSARGVQTSGFTVPAGGEVSLTIDFDVRKSLVKAVGQDGYKLKPVLRLVDNAQVGTIKGTIGQTLLATCTDANAYAGGVYIFEELDVTPNDLGSENEPLVVAPVDTETGEYDYTAAFLPAGDYTVAYTCDMDERQDAEGNMIDEELDFTPGVNAEVIEGEVTTVDLTAAES
ncbi:DUF4382 domain-containing protein [Marinobacter sp. SS13-12]|uniref:DUF4382 domain-containing protein n=1 Tax=Marinobacter sp. SS13-12 TaxID=3050451 RepID=UPI00255570FC|nr:DUF4382 domain-containing protein [Marinobacter sp. SS13-12]MDK8465501.1 DUF4382 domain-containing protein [Marinobacter sp. SS13-12]